MGQFKWQLLYFFPNGYGASLVKDDHYKGYELALTTWVTNSRYSQWTLCYHDDFADGDLYRALDPEKNNDVPYGEDALDFPEVQEKLRKISMFPPDEERILKMKEESSILHE